MTSTIYRFLYRPKNFFWFVCDYKDAHTDHGQDKSRQENWDIKTLLTFHFEADFMDRS